MQTKRITRAQVLKHFTGRELAQVLGVTRQALQRWGAYVPLHHMETLERKEPNWRKRRKPVYYNQHNRHERKA